MSPQINLDAIDVDGAVREAAEEVSGDTRLDFLRKGAVGGGAVFGGAALMGAVPGAAMAMGHASGHGRPPHSLGKLKFGKGDIGILNFALTLEFLERKFYNEATDNNAAGNNAQLAAFLKIVTKDERAHVAFLQSALGSKAIKEPKFAFGAATKDQGTFAATAETLENTGVHAYLGQAGNLKKPAYLAAAASILTIEARHSGAIGLINDPTGARIAPVTRDTPFTAQQVVAGAGKFIVG